VEHVPAVADERIAVPANHLVVIVLCVSISGWGTAVF
jgi:hypothetical protein